MQVVGNSTKSKSCNSKKTSKHLRGRDRALGRPHLTRCLQTLDEGTSISVGVVGNAISQAGLTLARVFVETFTDLKDFILILLITIVLIVGILGFLARHTIGINKRLRGVGKSLPITELLVGTTGGGEGASLIHESSKVDGLSVGRAVGTYKELHLLLLITVVLVLLVVDTLVVVVVLEGVFIHIHFLALNSIFEFEFDLVLVVVIVVVAVIAVVKTGSDVALVFIIIITILPYHLTIVLLRIQLTLNVCLHECIHINDIISTVGTAVTIPSRTELEVDQTLLVHAIVSILVVLVIITVTTELLTVVLVGGGTLLEFEGVTRDPGEVVVAVELTGCGEDAVAEFRGGGDVGGGDLDGGCGGGCGEGGEEGDGAKHL